MLNSRFSKSSALEHAHRVAERLAERLAHETPASEPPPPGPRGSLLLGSYREVWNDPLALFARCMTEFGPIARLRVGASFYYLLNHPDLVHHVFVDNYRNYKKSRSYRGIQIVLGDGLFTSEGEPWRRQRKLAQPAFHRERLAAFAETMSQTTQDLLSRLAGVCNQPLLFHEEMSELALSIVCRTLFSEEPGEPAAAIRESVSFANEYAGSPYFLPTWLPTPQNRALERALAVFDSLAYRMIAARRAGSTKERGDLLSMLMAVKDEATGEGMSDRELRDATLTLIIGGHETTATVLCWTFYLLSRHPEIERRLRSHIRSVLGDRAPTVDALPRLGYVTQVLQESMRLYPPAWVMEREALGEDRLLGYRIPAGATLAVSPYTLHRHPDYWSQPEGFDPDRFAPEQARERSRYIYLPFGSGPHLCIGNAFAMMEMVIIVSMIVRDFSLELVPGQRVEPEPLMTLRPKHGLRMVPRRVSHKDLERESHAQ